MDGLGDSDAAVFRRGWRRCPTSRRTTVTTAAMTVTTAAMTVTTAAMTVTTAAMTRNHGRRDRDHGRRASALRPGRSGSEGGLGKGCPLTH
jgi:hypothetical protein